MAVHSCLRRNPEWARAPQRLFGRALAPLFAAVEQRPVTWMPSHCDESALPAKHTSTGAALTVGQVRGNDLADHHAKKAAQQHRLPHEQAEAVRTLWDRVTAIATWIGTVTAAANHFELPASQPGCRRVFIRDSLGKRPARAQPNAMPSSPCPPPAVAPSAVQRPSAAAASSEIGQPPSAPGPQTTASAVARRQQIHDVALEVRCTQQRVNQIGAAARPPPVPASVRLDALRDRVRRRADTARPHD